ncbi:transmembrane protein [Cystoisospora suis]|uniref:Transmembrane protein n=1 Tax=Cystoisospora suis TaxID=483139 RepID=A0A2C6KDP7_9APIC|nr:transmembrane protein [Cystoisospora suis]
MMVASQAVPEKERRASFTHTNGHATTSSAVTTFNQTSTISFHQDEIPSLIVSEKKKNDYLSATSSSGGVGVGVNSTSTAILKGNSDGRQSSQGIQSDCSTFEYLPNDLACSSSSAYSPASPFLLEDLDSDQHTAPSGISGSEEEEDVLSSSSSRVISAVAAAVHDETGEGGEGATVESKTKQSATPLSTSPVKDDELGGEEKRIEKGGEEMMKGHGDDEEEREGELSVQMTILQSLADGSCEQTTSSTVMKIPPTVKREEEKGERDFVRARNVEEDGDGDVVLLKEKGKKMFMDETTKSPGAAVSVHRKKDPHEEEMRERRGEALCNEEMSLSKLSTMNENEMWKGVGVHDGEETIRKSKEQCTYTRRVMLQHYVTGLKLHHNDKGLEKEHSGSHDVVDQHAIDTTDVSKATPLNDGDSVTGEEKDEEREDPHDYLALVRGLKAVERRSSSSQGGKQPPQRASLAHHHSFDSNGDDDGSPVGGSGSIGGTSPPGGTSTMIRRYSSRYSLSSNQSHHTSTGSGGNQAAGQNSRGIGGGGEGGGSIRTGGGANGFTLHRGSSTTTATSSQNSLDSDDVLFQRVGGGSSSSMVCSSLSGSPTGTCPPLNSMSGSAHGNHGVKRNVGSYKHEEEEQVPPEDLVLSEEFLSLNLQQQRSQGGGGRKDEDGSSSSILRGGKNVSLGIRRNVINGDGRTVSSSRGGEMVDQDEEGHEGEGFDELTKRRISGGSSFIAHKEEGVGGSNSGSTNRRERDVDNEDWRDFRRTAKSQDGDVLGGEQEEEKKEGRSIKKEDEDLIVGKTGHEASCQRSISSHKVLNGDAHHVLQRALKFKQLDIAVTVYDNLKRENIQIDRRNYTLLVQIGMSRKDVPLQSRWLLEMIDEGHSVDPRWLDRLLAAAAVCDPTSTSELNRQLRLRSSALSPECMKVLDRAAGCYIWRGLNLLRRSSCSLRSSSNGTQKSSGMEEKTERPAGDLSSLSAPWTAGKADDEGLKELITGGSSCNGRPNHSSGGDCSADPPASPSLNPHAPEFVPLNFLRPHHHHHQGLATVGEMPAAATTTTTTAALHPPPHTPQDELLFPTGLPTNLVEAVALSLSGGSLGGSGGGGATAGECSVGEGGAGHHHHHLLSFVAERTASALGGLGNSSSLNHGKDELLLMSTTSPVLGGGVHASSSSVGGRGGVIRGGGSPPPPCSSGARQQQPLPYPLNKEGENLSITPVTALHFLQQQNHTDSVTSSLLAMLSNSPPLTAAAAATTTTNPAGNPFHSSSGGYHNPHAKNSSLDAMLLPATGGGIGIGGIHDAKRPTSTTSTLLSSSLVQRALDSMCQSARSYSPAPTTTSFATARLMTKNSRGKDSDEKASGSAAAAIGGGAAMTSSSSSSSASSNSKNRRSTSSSGRGDLDEDDNSGMASHRGGMTMMDHHRKEEYQSMLASAGSSGSSSGGGHPSVSAPSSIYQTENLRLQMQEMIAKAKNRTADEILRGMLQESDEEVKGKEKDSDSSIEAGGVTMTHKNAKRKPIASGGGGDKHPHLHRSSLPVNSAAGKKLGSTSLHEEASSTTTTIISKDGGVVAAQSDGTSNDDEKNKSSAPSGRKGPFSSTSNKNTRYVRDYHPYHHSYQHSKKTPASSSSTAPPTTKQKDERVNTSCHGNTTNPSSSSSSSSSSSFTSGGRNHERGEQAQGQFYSSSSSNHHHHHRHSANHQGGSYLLKKKGKASASGSSSSGSGNAAGGGGTRGTTTAATATAATK